MEVNDHGEGPSDLSLPWIVVCLMRYSGIFYPYDDKQHYKTGQEKLTPKTNRRWYNCYVAEFFVEVFLYV